MKKNKFFKFTAITFASIFLAGNLAAAYAGTDYIANSPNKNYQQSLLKSSQSMPSVPLMVDSADF